MSPTAAAVASSPRVLAESDEKNQPSPIARAINAMNASGVMARWKGSFTGALAESF